MEITTKRQIGGSPPAPVVKKDVLIRMKYAINTMHIQTSVRCMHVHCVYCRKLTGFRVLCKSVEPPLVSLCYASKEPNGPVNFEVVFKVEQKFSIF